MVGLKKHFVKISAGLVQFFVTHLQRLYVYTLLFILVRGEF